MLKDKVVARLTVVVDFDEIPSIDDIIFDLNSLNGVIELAELHILKETKIDLTKDL